MQCLKVNVIMIITIFFDLYTTGSILGPLLFLLYVNDIVKSSKLLTFILYADDTNVFYSHTNLDTLTSILNVELSKIYVCLSLISYL